MLRLDEIVWYPPRYFESIVVNTTKGSNKNTNCTDNFAILTDNPLLQDFIDQSPAQSCVKLGTLLGALGSVGCQWIPPLLQSFGYSEAMANLTRAACPAVSCGADCANL